MSAMKRLFQVMAEKKASDIFLSVGAPINIKINGVAIPINQTVLNADAVKTLLYEVLNEKQIKEYEEEWELNTAFVLENVGAFRISARKLPISRSGAIDAMSARLGIPVPDFQTDSSTHPSPLACTLRSAVIPSPLRRTRADFRTNSVSRLWHERIRDLVHRSLIVS